MKRLICILASLMFLASCEKETIPDLSPCQLMTISDALPVQFWPSDCDTYNETVPKGVHEACFCAPWQCDDEIKDQFQDDTGQTFFLGVKNSSGVLIAFFDYEEIAAGVYAASFIPSEEGICDEDIQLVRMAASGVELLSNPSFVAALSPWTSEAGANANWTWNAGEYAVATGTTDNIIQPFAAKAAGVYVFEFRSFSEANGYTIIIEVFNAAVLVQQVVNEVLADGSLQTRRRVVEVSGAFNTIKIRMVAPSGTPEFQLHFAGMMTGVEHQKSDCLNVATIQDETELFRYSNERNVAGLVYANMSPDPAFSIRVPCRFFHEDFPEEDEAMELTSSVITTSSSMKSQKLLEVKHAPYYFHKKLKIILKHHSVTNNGVAYKKEEKYEINKGNMRWPLKSATCLLTEKNSVLRNVL